MPKNPDESFGLLADLEAVEDLSNFKRDWAYVFDPILEKYDVTAAERVRIIDELYENFTKYEEEDVVESDVIDAIHTIRATDGDLH